MYVASSTCLFSNIETAVRELRPIGIRSLEVYEVGLGPGHWHLRVAERSAGELKETKKRLERDGMKVCAISGHVPLVGEGRAMIRAALSHLRRCMAAAELLGCPVVVTASGGGKGTGNRERDWHDLCGRVRRLSARAADHGVRIAFEPHYGEFVATTDDLRRLMEAVASPHLGINYDAAGLKVAGEDIAASIASVAQWVIHTHIRDIAKGNRRNAPQIRRECVPGTGTIDFRAIVQTLANAGYQGALSIELHKVYENRVDDHLAARRYLEEELNSLRPER